MKGSNADLVQAIEVVEGISHLLSHEFKNWFEDASGVLTRYWNSYTATESYRSKIKYKKRVANREDLYKKRMKKYGKF